MAKQNGKIKLFSLIITLAILFAGIVATWAVYGENIEDNAGAVTKLDKEGCNPATQNKLDIALVKKDVSTVQETQKKMETEQKEMRIEQRQGFEKILKRLPK